MVRRLRCWHLADALHMDDPTRLWDMDRLATGYGHDTLHRTEHPDPTVRFYGQQSEGLRALSVAMEAGLRVAELRRVWPVLDNEPTGPWWELTFVSTGQ
jgi:hypothetical protein